MAMYTGTRLADRIVGRDGDDEIDGRNGDDVLIGREGSDDLFGGHGDDVLRGGAGRDFLTGGGGDDVLYGGSKEREGKALPRDFLVGGSGDDTLCGGFGTDSLTGGPGKDRFLFRAVSDSLPNQGDGVSDFEQGRDKLVFRDEFRDAGTLHFIGTAAFSGTAGEVRYDTYPMGTYLALDLDGDRRADFELTMGPGLQLRADDFSF